MNDEERTDETPPPEGPPPPGEPPTAPTEVLEEGPRPGPRRLLRSSDDRMVAGVAGGLGRYFSVDPVIFRIGFVISVFFGGLGALAYLALALFVPSEPGADGEQRPAPVQRSGWLGIAAGVAIVVVALSAAGSLFFWDWGWGRVPWGLLFVAAIAAGVYALLRDRKPRAPAGAGRTIAMVALAIAIAIGLIAIGVVAAFAAATGSGVVIAAFVIAIGAMLVIGAFVGGARWLIAPALALAIPLGAISAANVSFAGGIGEHTYTPATAAQVQDRYELGVGRLVVDLRNLHWTPHQRLPLDVDLGVGELAVIVPPQVCVNPDLHVGAGELAIGSGTTGGAGLDQTAAGAATGPSLDLHGELDVGSLRVLNNWSEGARFGHFEGDGDRAAVC